MDKIEELIIKKINENIGEIISFADDIYCHPELGFKEIRTAAAVAEKLENLGIQVRKELAITGVKGYLKPKDVSDSREDLSVAIVGELDAVKSPEHEKADK